jgi:hypothetical protein
MTVTPQVAQIRVLVARIFRELGVAAHKPKDVQETVLLDRRRCVARSYRSGGLLAMWLLAAGVVQFYDVDGTMLRSINLFQQARPHRMAA